MSRSSSSGCVPKIALKTSTTANAEDIGPSGSTAATGGSNSNGSRRSLLGPDARSSRLSKSYSDTDLSRLALPNGGLQRRPLVPLGTQQHQPAANAAVGLQPNGNSHHLVSTGDGGGSGAGSGGCKLGRNSTKGADATVVVESPASIGRSGRNSARNGAEGSLMDAHAAAANGADAHENGDDLNQLQPVEQCSQPLRPTTPDRLNRRPARSFDSEQSAGSTESSAAPAKPAAAAVPAYGYNAATSDNDQGAGCSPAAELLHPAHSVTAADGLAPGPSGRTNGLRHSSSVQGLAQSLAEEGQPPYRLKVVGHSLGASNLLIYMIMRYREGKPHHVSRCEAASGDLFVCMCR